MCEDLDHVGALTVRPGTSGVGSVGVNGATKFVGAANVSGDLIAYGGLSAVGATVGESLRTTGDAQSTGDLHVGTDATIGGNLTCVGNVAIAGTLALFVVQFAAGLLNLSLLAPIGMQLVHLMLADATWIALVLMAWEAWGARGRVPAPAPSQPVVA